SSEVGQVRLEVAARQDAAVDLRMERLDPAAEDLRGASDLGRFLDVEARIPQDAGRAPRGDELEARRNQPFRKGNQVGLVGNGKQRTPRGRHGLLRAPPLAGSRPPFNARLNPRRRARVPWPRAEACKAPAPPPGGSAPG